MKHVITLDADIFIINTKNDLQEKAIQNLLTTMKTVVEKLGGTDIHDA